MKANEIRKRVYKNLSTLLAKKHKFNLSTGFKTWRMVNLNKMLYLSSK